MPHWKMTLTYDGTPYNGWQIQPSVPTIQGTLARAIHRVTAESVLPQGSGRTDTGVHALAQVATFTLTTPIPAQNLHRALNRALPSSIRILSVESVPENFHARYAAHRKTYEYRILPDDRICSPMLASFVWACRFSLDLDALKQAAAYVVGTHDFTSFAANDPDLTTRNANLGQTLTDRRAAVDNLAASTLIPATKTAVTGIDSPTGKIRTIHYSDWHRDQDLLIYRVTGSGFLHHMVRNLVGTFVDQSSRPDAIPSILAARNRSAAGPTAPARGLFLVEVEY